MIDIRTMDEYNARNALALLALVPGLPPIHIVEEPGIVPYPRRIAKRPQVEPRTFFLTDPVTPAKTQYRNAKCACGSGMKYKHCCARKP